MTSLGDQVKQLFHEQIDPKFEFKGCTDDEIEQVKAFQNISYIPQAYCDLLRVTGHRGLSWFAMGEADWDLLKDVKDNFTSMARRLSIAFPQDLLVFYDGGGIYYFCRTKDQLDNPPVYGYTRRWWGEKSIDPGFAKLSDTLSGFWLMLVDDYKNRRDGKKENFEPLAQVYYDIDLDEFCEVEK